MVRLAITSEIAKARTFHTGRLSSFAHALRRQPIEPGHPHIPPALLALLAYDAACTLPRERRTMWKRPTAMSICYLVTR